MLGHGVSSLVLVGTCRKEFESGLIVQIKFSQNFDLAFLTKNLNFRQNLIALTTPKVTKGYKWDSRKCAKSEYVIEGGLIWGRNRCPGSVCGVGWHRRTVCCGARGPWFKSRGNPPFVTPPFLRR